VDVEHWLRGQERFTDIDELTARIRADVERTRALLGP
jgi:FAD synthase